MTGKWAGSGVMLFVGLSIAAIDVALADDASQTTTDAVGSIDSAKVASTAVETGPLPQRDAFRGVDADVFARHAWHTPPPKPTRRAPPKPVKHEPVAPPLPYKLLGTYEEEGQETLYFLVKGDATYDVRIGDTLDDTYQVDGVSNGQLMFTYLPLNTSQGLRLGD